MQKERKEIFKDIELLLLDVDGVLTRGELIYGDDGTHYKSFNVKDGLGVFILKEMGIKTIIVTAKDSSVVFARAKSMKAADVYAGVLPKIAVLEEITQKHGVDKSKMCFVGDDLIDIGIMKEVGVSVAVNDAVKEVKDIADYVAENKGGCGAVREVVELILKSKGLWEKAVEKIVSIDDSLVNTVVNKG